MLSTESVEREQEELTRFDALDVMTEDYLESTIIGNKRLTAVREKVASIYSKDQSNISEADVKELEEIFGKIYTLEAKRRLILYHDEKQEFQPKLFKLDGKELNQILAKHRPPLPSVKQWFRVFEDTEAKVEALNNQVQSQPSEVGAADGKRRRDGDRDLSKAQRHTALNVKHAGAKRKGRSRSRSRSRSGGRSSEPSKRHRHGVGHVEEDVHNDGGKDGGNGGGKDKEKDKAGQDNSRKERSRSPSKGEGDGNVKESQASRRRRSRSRSRSRGRGGRREDSRHSSRRRGSPNKEHKYDDRFQRPRSRSPRNQSRSLSRSQSQRQRQRQRQSHNGAQERRHNGGSGQREDIAKAGGKGESRSPSRNPDKTDLRKEIELLTSVVKKLASDQKTMVEDICSKVKATTDKQIGGFEIIYSEAILKKFKNVEYIALEEIWKLIARGLKSIKTKDVSLTDGVKLTLSDDVVTAGGMSLWDIFRSLFEIIYGYIHVGKSVDARLAESMWQYYRNLWAIAGRYTTQSLKEVDEYARGKEEAQGLNAQWTLDMHAHFRILRPKAPRPAINLKGGGKTGGKRKSIRVPKGKSNICFPWAEGLCTRGEECMFDHFCEKCGMTAPGVHNNEICSHRSTSSSTRKARVGFKKPKPTERGGGGGGAKATSQAPKA